MIPAYITDKLMSLSASQKLQIVDMCITHLRESSGNMLMPLQPASYIKLKHIKMELDRLMNTHFVTTFSPKVAGFVVTGKQPQEVIMDVYDFARRLRTILNSKAYANREGITNNKYKKIDQSVNQLIVFLAELTASIDLKIVHQQDKNFSFRSHNRTFEQQASEFIKQVIKEEQVNAKSSSVMPTSTQTQIKNLVQGNNRNSVTALIATFNGMLTKQAVHNLDPINQKSVTMVKNNELPRVKLTIR